MLKQLKRLLHPGDPLVELAKSGESELFARSFAESEVYVVSIAPSRSLDPHSLSADGLEAAVEEAARAAAATEGLEPFTFGPEGDESLPVFSCQETAAEFVKGYVRTVERVVPFVIAGLEGAALVPLLSARRLSVVLNPLAESEYELPRELVSALEARGSG